MLTDDRRPIVLCCVVRPCPGRIDTLDFSVGTGGGHAGRPFPDGGCHVLRALRAVRAQTSAVLPEARAAASPEPTIIRVRSSAAQSRRPAAIRVRSSAAELRRPAAGAGQPARRHVRQSVGGRAATGVRHRRSVAAGRRIG